MDKSLNPRDESKNLPDTPHHLVSSHFPSHTFESAKKVDRNFQSSWCHCFSWIHYNNAQDLVFCFICCKDAKEGKLQLNGTEENRCFVNFRFANIVIYVIHDWCEGITYMCTLSPLSFQTVHDPYPLKIGSSGPGCWAAKAVEGIVTSVLNCSNNGLLL